MNIEFEKIIIRTKIVIRTDCKSARSDYRSALYSKDGKYVLAFAGTNPGSMADIKTDIQSIVSGKSEQFETALDEARSVVNEYGKGNVEFTGHSLGGGLASAASLATGSHAITFNALGLSRTLKSNLGISSGDTKNINAFIIRGEAVDYYQSSIGLRAEGNRYYIPAGPVVAGLPQRIALHMMGAMKPALTKHINRQISNYKKIKN
jgi:hypothetical protein